MVSALIRDVLIPAVDHRQEQLGFLLCVYIVVSALRPPAAERQLSAPSGRGETTLSPVLRDEAGPWMWWVLRHVDKG